MNGFEERQPPSDFHDEFPTGFYEYCVQEDAKERAAKRKRNDLDFLALAKFWAERRSKDPSTKVGCVIVDPNGRICGIGYNGFPKGVEDLPERYADREIKYPMVVHAEANAILFSSNTKGCTAYIWPLFSCCDCAGLVIQAGIRRVVSPPPKEERWASAYKMARTMYDEAGVEVTHYEIEDIT
jgi:dCMP deaminase